MNEASLKTLLDSVKGGRTSVEQALRQLRHLPFESLGFANVDHHRSIRCGFPEVIFCPGKTVEQTRIIFSTLAARGGNVLATRADRAKYEAVAADFPAAQYHELPPARSRCGGAARPPKAGPVTSPWLPPAPATCRLRKRPV